jgi:hypothetical protein
LSDFTWVRKAKVAVALFSNDKSPVITVYFKWRIAAVSHVVREVNRVKKNNMVY